jgi:membrane protease YdiL (CAAX protease family)
LRSIESVLAPYLIAPLGTGVAVCIAALGAGVMHLYQGPRAVVIMTQLSVLFGVLFVISGYNLWAVMVCHGLYDTIAFVRFAYKKSKYSDLDGRN